MKSKTLEMLRTINTVPRHEDVDNENERHWEGGGLSDVALLLVSDPLINE